MTAGSKINNMWCMEINEIPSQYDVSSTSKRICLLYNIDRLLGDMKFTYILIKDKYSDGKISF